MTANKSCISWIGREIWRRKKEAVVEQETGVEGMFPKVRLSRNKWTEAEHITGQGSGTGKGYRKNVFQFEPDPEQAEYITGQGSGTGRGHRKNVFQVEPEPEQVNQSETYNLSWLWFRRSSLDNLSISSIFEGKVMVSRFFFKLQDIRSFCSIPRVG